MISVRTVREQTLPVLKATLERVAAGVPVAAARHMAIHEQATKTHVTYNTIVDGLRRRLRLRDIAALDDLIASWIETGGRDLMEVLLRAADPTAHADIIQFFADTYPPANQEFRTVTGLAETPLASYGPITLEGLTPAVIAGLEARARANGRSLEAEIEAILENVVLGAGLGATVVTGDTGLAKLARAAGLRVWHLSERPPPGIVA